MIVKVIGEKFEYANDKQLINEMLKLINSELTKNNLLLNYLIINGEHVYNELENYIIKNIQDINTIEVIGCTRVDLINDTIISMQKNVENIIPEIESLSTEFYAQPTKETWNKFDTFLQSFMLINQAIRGVDKSIRAFGNDKIFEEWNEVFATYLKVNDTVAELEDAIKNNDFIIMADILKYEIQPLFNVISNLILEIKNKKVN